jgi:hypothetical protein
MKKHLLSCAFIGLSMSMAMAQLTLQKLGKNHKISVPIGSLIEIKLPTETSRLDCNCFKSFEGYLQYANKDSAVVNVTKEAREYIDANKASIREVNIYSNINESTLVSVPLSKALSISRLSKENTIQQAGILFSALAIFSNLFIAPNLIGSDGNAVRNGGYAVMGLGVAMALLPTRRVFYLQQPKKGKKKTLWKLLD